MKLLKYILLVSILITISCKESKKEDDSTDLKTEETVENKTKTVTLKRLWKTDTTLITCEAVRYDANKSIIYTSNIGGVPPDKKDGDGTLSILSTDGKILTQNWVTGLNAPKGLDIYSGKLYVTDIDEVVRIDIASAKIEKTFKVEGAKFLNDLDIDNEGNVYFTDSGTDKIYIITNDELSLWKEIPGFNPNGIFVENDHILVIAYEKGDLIAVDKETKTETLIAKGIMPGGDGIVAINSGYIVSTWPGEVYFVDKNAKGEAAIKILDTKGAKLNAADIGIIANEGILLVPTFFGNIVEAYKIDVE